MKKNRIDYEKRNCGPRPKIVKLYKETNNVKEEGLTDEEDGGLINESDSDNIEEEEFDPEPVKKKLTKPKIVPEPIDNSDRVLEERVFGVRFPHGKREKKILSKKRKELLKVKEVETRKVNPHAVMSTVSHILETQDEEDDEVVRRRNTLKLSSLFKTTQRRKKKPDSDSSSCEDSEEDLDIEDYVGDMLK